MKNKIIIGLGIVVLILLNIILIPNILEPFRNKYIEKGYNSGYQNCLVVTINQIVNDLNTIGYTELRLNNQTVRLAPIQ